MRGAKGVSGGGNERAGGALEGRERSTRFKEGKWKFRGDKEREKEYG